MSRQWCGPLDPDPNVAQIGAVKLSLGGGYDILDTFNVLIKLRDRFGRHPNVDPFFTELTGITQADIDREGIAHADALERFAAFAEGRISGPGARTNSPFWRSVPISKA